MIEMKNVPISEQLINDLLDESSQIIQVNDLEPEVKKLVQILSEKYPYIKDGKIGGTGLEHIRWALLLRECLWLGCVITQKKWDEKCCSMIYDSIKEYFEFGIQYASIREKRKRH
jgi:hypothetical protein